MNSVLTGIKELLGIPESVTDFDNQLVMYTNMAFMSLHDIGFMPSVAVYQMTLEDGDLDDYLPADPSIHHTIMIYLHAKVRLVFDPPASAFVLASLEKFIAEQEWRLSNYEL
jgi:hypothetical protein